MKRSDGFLLIETLISAAVVALALLAAADALSSVTIRRRRSDAVSAIAGCAELTLATTLMGTAAPSLPCNAGLRVDAETPSLDGRLERVPWRIADGDAAELFTASRYAR